MNNLQQVNIRESKQAGSALLISMIFSTLLAVISVPIYLRLSQNTLSLLNRAHYNVAAVNLSESGVEYAVQTIKEAAEGRADWTDWTTEGSDIYIALDPVNYAGNVAVTGGGLFSQVASE